TEAVVAPVSLTRFTLAFTCLASEEEPSASITLLNFSPFSSRRIRSAADDEPSKNCVQFCRIWAIAAVADGVGEAEAVVEVVGSVACFALPPPPQPASSVAVATARRRTQAVRALTLGRSIRLASASIGTWSRRGGRRAVEGVPARVAGARRLLRRAAPTQAEETLREQQVEDDGEVDDDREHLERRDCPRQLVHLERHERGRRHERQVLGPAALVPEADRLRALEQRVDGGGDADQP